MAIDKIFVQGTAVIDALIKGSFDVEGSSVTIHSGSISRSFRVKDGPVRPGEKYTLTEPVDEVIYGFDHKKTVGGGGINSIRAIRALDGQIGLHYLGLSNNDPILSAMLSASGIVPDLRGSYKIPINLVLNDGTDRTILMSPIEGRTTFNEADLGRINENVPGSSAVLLNNPKSESLVEHTLMSNSGSVPVNVVITNKLETGFILNYLLPRANVIISFEDAVKLKGEESYGKEGLDSIASAVEFVDRIKIDRKGKYQRVYLTMGRYGALSLEDSATNHVMLSNKHFDKVQEIIARRPGSTNGAGDVFAGGVTYHGRKSPRNDILEILIGGCLSSVRHIGYQSASSDGFVTSPSFQILQT